MPLNESVLLNNLENKLRLRAHQPSCTVAAALFDEREARVLLQRLPGELVHSSLQSFCRTEKLFMEASSQNRFLLSRSELGLVTSKIRFDHRYLDLLFARKAVVTSESRELAIIQKKSARSC